MDTAQLLHQSKLMHLFCKVLAGAWLAMASCREAAICVSAPTAEGGAWASPKDWNPATMPLYLAFRFSACTPTHHNHDLAATVNK